jgi:hypothetical protein
MKYDPPKPKETDQREEEISDLIKLFSIITFGAVEDMKGQENE